MRGNYTSAARALSLGRFAACAVLALIFGLGAPPAKAAPFAYVANHDSNNVSVIDTATNKVVATIPVGHSPNGIAVTPDGKRVYVTNDNDFVSGLSVIAVIDTSINRVVARISLGDVIPVGTAGIAMSPNGKSVYVATN
jgi:YVTN family beta-propeller protein